MADKKTILYSVVLAILISGGMNLPNYIGSNEDMIGLYFCGSRNIVMDCDSLSAGLGTRCYYEDTYKICKEGWQKLESTQGLTIGIHVKEGNKWLCAPEGCEVIK